MTDNNIIKVIEEAIDILEANGSIKEIVLPLSRGIVEDIIRIYNQQKAEIEYWKKRYERTMDNLKAILEERGETE